MRTAIHNRSGLVIAAFGIALAGVRAPRAQEASMDQTIPIGGRLEMFVDRHLIARLDSVTLRLHEPRLAPLPENPLPVSYTTVIKDGALYRGYYRDYVNGYRGPKHDGNPGEITCYAESSDGHEWTFPELGIIEAESEKGSNVVLAGGTSGCSHNFSPFLDTRPGADAAHRFKALAGTHDGGLYAFASADGTLWTRVRETPVITSTGFAFDSQNVAFWSMTEDCYVCYFRTWDTPHGRLRTISRTTSDDFLAWSDPVATNPNAPGEHLYTSQTHPYYRAPHIYIALPTRFMPDRGSSTDILFMATRAGSASFARLFGEAFIRPGLDPSRWGNRSNYVALNVVPTGPAELSLYHKSGHRYVLRPDGFISVRAGTAEGELLSKLLTFAGDTLILNYSTSAAGRLRVEIQNPDGTPVPGFGLGECSALIGDAIEGTAGWSSNADLGALAGKPVRLRFVMTECDLYSLQFRRNGA